MKEIDVKKTSRAEAFELWMSAPMPMITFHKTLDVTGIVRYSRRHGYKFNMLMCWCIGKAASCTEEFYILPVGDRLIKYDRLAISTVIAAQNGKISTCDIPFNEDLQAFSDDYLRLLKRVQKTGEAYELGDDFMVIGTSALVEYCIDGAVNIYARVYNNPFLIWGKYRRKFIRKILPMSFQFHHVQMDGLHAAGFLKRFQEEMDKFKAAGR